MKKLIIISVGLLGFNSNVTAQNIPDGSSLPSGSMNGIVTTPYNFGQSPNPGLSTYNFTREFVPLAPMSSIPAFENSNGAAVVVNTTYTDGFGNKLMTVNRNNAGSDIVVPYNNRPSRTSVSYLGYPAGIHTKFHSAVYSTQKGFYQAWFGTEDNTAYSKTVSYSNQGLPTTKSYIPGKAYVGQERGTTTTTYFNSANEVYILEDSSGHIVKKGTYAAGTLMVAKTEGQHGSKAMSYTDKGNKLICKKAWEGIGGNGGWLETYYVYNDLGKLVHVVPPKASVQLVGNNIITNKEKLCYSYIYNEHGEAISKRVPGKQSNETVVYDSRRRAVLSQSAKMKSAGKFAFTIYEKSGRVLMTGLLNGGGHDAAWWQSQIDANNTSIPIISYLYDGHSGGYPSTITGCELLSFNYYDTYDQWPADETGYDSTTFANDFLTSSEMITPKPYYFMHGKLVATRVKIVDNGVGNNFVNQWITSVYYYDEQGRVIQTRTENPWTNDSWDINAVQYNFSGQTVLSISRHTSWGSTNKMTTKVQTWNIHDPLSGRLQETKKKYDNYPWASIATYQYNQLGQVTKKWIGGVEEQNYAYDIRGNLRGINPWNIDIGLAPTMTYAEALFREAGFSERRFDGALSGFQWRSKSSPQSAYGYTYDTLGRMVAADYRDWSTHNSVAGWNKGNRDYSVSEISYDVNGNMLSMNQRGRGGSGQPATIDSLIYSYDVGNQLASVTDYGANGPVTDDFDNSVLNQAFYDYDQNGNLAEDDLKEIQIEYNYQDLPLVVENHKTSGIIYNIYDAGGTLLQKIVDDNNDVDTFVYWGPFVYKNSDLQYVLHEEGRSRWREDSSFFKNDFFIKDHLGNVRTVVSYELEPLSVEYLATHEIASAGIEESIFSNISEVREDKPSPTLSDVDCALLNGAEEGTRIGTAIVLRAMAGDKFSVGAYSYHAGKNIEEDNYTSSEEMLSTVLGILGGGEGGGGESEGGGGSSVVNSIFNSNNYDVFNALKNNITNPAKPRAYLNYLVFDEEFNLNETVSGAVQVGGTANAWEYLSMPADVVVPQNGFIAIYISNEEALEVYFDNVTIIHTHARLIEEQNYYPHGLLTTKSVAATGADPENKFQYQGKEMQDKIGLHLYDFHARQYDPQIGRFWGIDPADQFPSGYTGMGNDPANMIDPSGMYASNYSIMDRSRAKIWAYNRRKLADEAWAERAWRASRLLPKEVVNWGSRLEDGGFDVETARESFWKDYHHRAEQRVEKKIADQKRAYNNFLKDLSKEGYVLLKVGKNTYWGVNGELLFGKEAVDQYIKDELGLAAKDFASKEPTGGDADRTFEGTNTEMACSGPCESMTDGNGDQGNGKTNHYKESYGQPVYTMDQFLEGNYGQNFLDIITQRPDDAGLPGGPIMRYVINPTDGNVMDMRHVMVIGFYMGNVGGVGVEAAQWLGGLFGHKSGLSAFDRQDFYSNNIGSSFRDHMGRNNSYDYDWSAAFYYWINR